MSLLSHVSAFEYWRHVGTPGFPMPQAIRSTYVPATFNDVDFEWLASMGLLSLPLHGLTSKKPKNYVGGTYRHKAAEQLPRGSIFAISNTQLITSPELTLIQIAPHLSFAELAGLVCEFCGFYTLNEACETGIFKRGPLTSASRLIAFCNKAKGMTGVSATRQAARYALDRSRSPMETAAALLLTLPQQRGGYSLKNAELNRKILLSAKARRTAQIDELEPDILWAKNKVIVEYDSNAFHCDDSRIVNDARRKNAFLASGFQVITLTPKQLFSTSETDKIALQIAMCMGKRTRITNTELFKMRQRELRFDLLNDSGVLRKQYSLPQRTNQVIGRATHSVTCCDADEL